MADKPLIKWHAQKLYDLLMQDLKLQEIPGNESIVRLTNNLKGLLNRIPYKDIEAQPPEECK